jgi:hypothetical protein
MCCTGGPGGRSASYAWAATTTVIHWPVRAVIRQNGRALSGTIGCAAVARATTQHCAAMTSAGAQATQPGSSGRL